MSVHDICSRLENGALFYCDRDEDAGSISWTPHPKFPGVALKHLIAGADTEGRLSCHMVRVDPGCLLEPHIHPEQGELHEVIAGAGSAELQGKTVAYLPGVMAVIPKGTEHAVQASGEGLVLLAKFFPALV